MVKLQILMVSEQKRLGDWLQLSNLHLRIVCCLYGWADWQLCEIWGKDTKLLFTEQSVTYLGIYEKPFSFALTQIFNWLTFKNKAASFLASSCSSLPQSLSCALVKKLTINLVTHTESVPVCSTAPGGHSSAVVIAARQHYSLLQLP